MEHTYRNIKLIILLAGCLITSAKVFSFQYNDKFDIDSEQTRAILENNKLFPSEITYMEMYSSFISADVFNTEEVSANDIELGGVERDVPIHTELYFFTLFVILYGIKLFSSRKTNKAEKG